MLKHEKKHKLGELKMNKYAAIVLSAGTGSRMKSDIPKQYMDLKGFPVIYYSLKAFQDSDVSSIVLVTGADDVEYCRKEIVEKYNLTKVKTIVPGGSERYYSVYEGLKAIEDATHVMIHDGARPMLNLQIIKRIQEELNQNDACVVGMPVKDTIKIADEQGYCKATPERRYVWQIQTPQSFSYDLVKNAYEKLILLEEHGEDIPAVTDDAMVVEYATGTPIKFIEGDYKNIKITTPEDIQIAELFLK